MGKKRSREGYQELAPEEPPPTRRRLEEWIANEFNAAVHGKGCVSGEINLTDDEYKLLCRLLAPEGVALEEVMEEGGEQDEKEVEQQDGEMEDEDEDLFPTTPQQAKEAEDEKPAEGENISKSSRDILPENLVMEGEKAQKEKEEKAYIEKLLAKLTEEQLDKVIYIHKPRRDEKTGDYILAYDSMSDEDRDHLRETLEHVLDVKEEEVPEEQKSEEQKAEEKRAAEKHRKDQEEVEAMLKEFDSWFA
mmetsp:Transcript_6329/g.14584  ORF Transcript_6329/g.14584 Transcript_6329/m.14584 type:complete len:248 (+) Transcript_6329:80-823(+)